MKKTILILSASLITVMMVSCNKDSNEPNLENESDSNINYSNPIIKIDSVVNLTNTSVRVHINIISTGGGEQLSSLTSNYSLESEYNFYGTNTANVSLAEGQSFYDITGLLPAHNYLVDIIGLNAGMKSDFDTISFRTLPPSIGQIVNGGKCAYIFQPGDIGYDPSVAHGFYVSWKINTQTITSSVTTWAGCSGTLLGSDGVVPGSGKQNHNQIGMNCPGIGLGPNNAWRISQKYNDGNSVFDPIVSSWYLPSSGELLKIYENRNEIGLNISGSNPNNNYWSSTEFDANKAIVVNIGFGGEYPDNKENPVNNTNVLAIRYF